jgi:hypothetical protein
MAYNLTIAQLRYTKAQFTATNPVPLSGQLCIETDTQTAKVGDGSTAYASLPVVPLSGDERRSADDVWAGMNLAEDHPREYIAVISQSGTDAPTAVVIRNTLGVSVTLERAVAGQYAINAEGAFAEGAAVIGLGGVQTYLAMFDTNAEAMFYLNCTVSADVVTFSTLDAALSADDIGFDSIPVHIIAK